MSSFRHGQLQLDGISLHVVEAGDPWARPVVFVHGWPQSWVEWQAVMARAADQFRAIAIDLPGIGESSIGSTDGSKRALAGVVHRLIEQLGLDRPVLVGHDIGGMIAYAYLRHYQDVAGVVIVDVVIPGLEPWDEVLRNPYLWHFTFHAIPALPTLLVQDHQGPYLDYFFDGLAVDPARITPEARATYARAYASDAALAAGFDLYRAFPQDANDNLADTTAAVSTPVLYVRGEGSRGDLESYARGLRAAAVKHLTARLIPDAGHFIPDEQPAELWRTIRDFIATPPSERP
jgi:pimeloyl-ACP methyl ester carboxylesterase